MNKKALTKNPRKQKKLTKARFEPRISHTLAQHSTAVSLWYHLTYFLSLYLICIIHEETYINNTSKEETKPEPFPNPNSKVQDAFPKLNVRCIILLGACPRVEYSGNTRLLPTLACLKLNKNLHPYNSFVNSG